MNTPTTCTECGKVWPIDKMARDAEGYWWCPECSPKRGLVFPHWPAAKSEPTPTPKAPPPIPGGLLQGFELVGSKYIEEETIAYLFSDNVLLIHQNRLDRLKKEPAQEVLKDVKVKNLPFPANSPSLYTRYPLFQYVPQNP